MRSLKIREWKRLLAYGPRGLPVENPGLFGRWLGGSGHTSPEGTFARTRDKAKRKQSLETGKKMQGKTSTHLLPCLTSVVHGLPPKWPVNSDRKKLFFLLLAPKGNLTFPYFLPSYSEATKRASWRKRTQGSVTDRNRRCFRVTVHLGKCCPSHSCLPLCDMIRYQAVPRSIPCIPF